MAPRTQHARAADRVSIASQLLGEDERTPVLAGEWGLSEVVR